MKLIYCAGLLMLLTSCYSASMMQTAKTLDKGERETTVGVGPYTSYGDVLFSPDFMLRFGVSDKSDIGIFYSLQLNGHAKVDWKRELWSSPNGDKYLSSGAMLEAYMPNDFSGDPFYVGVCAPMYFSFNHGNKWVPYFGQRFSFGILDTGVFKFYNDDSPPLERLSFDHYMFYSGSLGLRFGEKRTKYFLEASYNYRINHSLNQYSYTDDNGITEWYLNKNYFDGLSLQLTLGLNIGRK